MSPITTHVLDTSRGAPAQNIPVVLEINSSSKEWQELGQGVTDKDGRVSDLMDKGSPLTKGTYRLTFSTEKYFLNQGSRGFYPYVAVVFEIEKPTDHYHVPLLLSPYGYSTYRGS